MASKQGSAARSPSKATTGGMSKSTPPTGTVRRPESSIEAQFSATFSCILHFFAMNRPQLRKALVTIE